VLAITTLIGRAITQLPVASGSRDYIK
jgi:hypothetical protein